MTEIYVSVDIKTAGPCVWLHKVLSIGIYVADKFGHRLETFRQNFLATYPFIDPLDGKLNYGDFEKMHWDTIGSKETTEMIDSCKRDATTEKSGWITIGKFMSYLDIKYGSNIRFISDNPCFVMSFINYKMSINSIVLNREKRFRPINYCTSSAIVRDVLCSKDMFSMIPIGIQSLIEDRVSSIAKRDCDTLTNARHNYLKLLEAMYYNNELNKMIIYPDE